MLREDFRVQHPSVSETKDAAEKARRWSGFVCPDCRFVFRVPQDHDGNGIVCPSCRRMLRIPRDGDVTGPLMAPLKKVGFAAMEVPDAGVKRVRGKRRKKGMDPEVPDWDNSEGKWRSKRKEESHGLRNTLMAVILVGSAGIVAYFLSGAGDPGNVVVTDEPVMEGAVQGVAIPLLTKLEEIELPSVMQKSEVEFLEEARPLAERFLAAEHVDELLPLIYNPQVVRERIRMFYPDGKIEPTELWRFNSAGTVNYRNDFAAVTITTGDFETKQLAYIDGPGGLKIDWESWVGWSEMSWAEFTELKPTEPKLFRVILRQVDYYNFDFKDERTWRSYRLISPDGEDLLYGYVERDSLLDQQIRPPEQSRPVSMILMLRYPENAEASQQVIIERYVADGWVIGEG